MWTRKCATWPGEGPPPPALETEPPLDCRCSRPKLAVRSFAVKSFFKMGQGEAAVLLFLILFSALSFLPVWRTIEVAGMVVFGWLMATLMVISPVLALVVFMAKRHRR